MALTVDRAPFRIRDARVHSQPGGLAVARHLDRPLRCHVPRVIEVEVGDVASQEFRVDESRVGVLRRVAGDGTGLLDRLSHRVLTEVRGARGALPLSEVHRDPKAPITLVLDRIDLTEPDRHAEPFADVGVGFTFRGALALGFVQHEADHVL